MSISNDLTPEQRQETQIILVGGQRKVYGKSYIKGNKLVVGQVAYDLEDLECS